ncbi:hypothetical protein BH23ACT10_BH23ACT10_18670 [soil metagenome]
MTTSHSPTEVLAVAAVVFDVGEVLIDETRVWHTWADLLGVTRLTFAAVLGAAVSTGDDHTVVFERLAPGVDWRAHEAAHEQAYGGFVDTDLYPDVRPTLRALRDGGITVVIAGNQPRRRRVQLERLELPADVIATSDDLGVAKPDPAFFARVCALAGDRRPADVLHVGDRIDNDVVPAARAGLRTAWLRRGPWGHLQTPGDVPPDLVLTSLGDLPTLLATATPHP